MIDDPWLALDLDVAIACYGAKVEREAIKNVSKNGQSSGLNEDKATTNKQFWGMVGKMRRMKGLKR